MRSSIARKGTAYAAALCVACVLAPAVRAAQPVSRSLGRWDATAGAARVVFTIEATARGARYLVRPVVYCGPTEATYFETSLFSLSQPDAWPIGRDGVITTGPLTGRFEDAGAKLRVVASGTCIPAGTELVAGPAPASPTVFDGTWNATLAEHDHGPIGEVVDLFTKGEGALIDSDWGVYDGGSNCMILRTGLELLVAPDGSFGATINGNQLHTEGITIHLSGRFVSSNVAEGSYTLSGSSDCSGQPVSFTAAFASAHQPPTPATGAMTLYRPKNDGGGTPGKEKPPEGGECKDLASISPAFKRLENAELPLASFSAGTLPIAVSGSIELGSVGVCDRAINALDPRIEFTPLVGLGLTAAYDFRERHLKSAFEFAFAPLGWHLAKETGAPRPESPTIDWGAAVKFGGVEVSPSLNFAFTRGEKPQPELDLVKVPVVQPTTTLIALGRPILEASVGPELSITMKVDREKLAEAENELTKEGESPQTAARQLAEQAQTDTQVAIDAEEGVAAPGEAVPGEAADIAAAVSDDMAATLTADAGAEPVASAVEALVIEGVADPALASDAVDVAGETFVTVGELAFEGRVRRSLPPSLHRSRGQLLEAGVIRAARIKRLRRRSLHRAPFPVRRIPGLVRTTLSLPVPARVGALVTTRLHLVPGARVSVIAPSLAGGPPHDAMLTLAGPGYRATRLLRVANGAAGATIKLPKHLAHGTWTISIQDVSRIVLTPRGDAVTGLALVRMGVFVVGGRR
jgi:hypothetical protein